MVEWCVTADIELVVCDKNSRVTTLLRHKSDTPQLAIIVCVETPAEDNLIVANKCGIKLLSFQQLEVRILI